MNKEQKTIKAIQEAVPEIMEIKKDCVIIEGPTRSNWCIIVGVDKNEIYIQSCINESYIWHITRDKFEEQYKEIIGRDITIGDIIIAIGKSLKNGDVINCYINNRGQLTFNNNVFIDLIPNTPFHLQSQETKDFIGDLLLTK